MASPSVGGVPTATFTTSTLTAGPHSLTATYAGDTNYKASPPSGAANETIDRATPSVAVSASPASIPDGQSESLTATVTAPSGVSGTPTGQVTFTDGSATLATVPLASSGASATATVMTSALGIGVHDSAPATAATPTLPLPPERLPG